MKIKKELIVPVIAGAILCMSGSVQAAAAGQDGWQGSGENTTIQKAAPDSENAGGTTGETGEIGLLGYIGNVTPGEREIDIDNDGKTDYIVPENDFISVSVTMNAVAIATMKADDTVDFRCGTLAVINTNEGRPVKVQVNAVSVNEPSTLKLKAWNDINSSNPNTKDEIALKIKVRRSDTLTDEKDVTKIQDGVSDTYALISEKLDGNRAVGYTLDGNYTNQMLEEHGKDSKMPQIKLEYKITPAS